MRKFSVFALCAASLLAFSAPASKAVSVTIQWGIGDIPGLSLDSVGLLVVDTGGDGFSNIGSGDWLGVDTSNVIGETIGANDLVIASSASIDFGGGLIGFNDGGTYNDPAIVTGDELAIFWFDGLTQGTPVPAGQAGGWFRTDTVQIGVTTGPMVVPPAGATVIVGAFSSNLGIPGGFDPNSFLANNGTVIPEPSVFALFGLGFASLLLRRRR